MQEIKADVSNCSNGQGWGLALALGGMDGLGQLSRALLSDCQGQGENKGRVKPWRHSQEVPLL